MKIYTPKGDYVASSNDCATSAALMAYYGDGAEIRNGHSQKRVVWKEGTETQSAGESYDYVAKVIKDRMTGAEPTDSLLYPHFGMPLQP